jgi:HSP20 family protein
MKKKEEHSMALEAWRPKRALAGAPWQELERIEERMEDMFRSFSRGFPWAWPRERGAGWMPPLDMVERKDEILLRVDLPGLQEKDIEVNVQDGMLTLRGERKEEREEKEEDYYYCERSLGKFSRSLPLPAGVDAEHVKATFKNGVLEVHLPRTKEAKAKKIEIKAA